MIAKATPSQSSQSSDWTPSPINPARRLFQVRRMLVTMPYLHADDQPVLEEFAANLERHVTANNKNKRKPC